LTGLIILLGGCAVNVTAIQGTGAMVSRAITVDDFNAIDISGGYVVIYRQSQTSSLTIEMQENLFEHIDVEVRGDTLHIGSGIRSISTTRANTPRIYIYAPYLGSASFSGAVDATDWDAISADSFSLVSSGAGNFGLALEVESLDIRASGSANIELSGNASNASITVSGSSDINAGALQTRDAEIRISGSGDAIIAASDSLDVNVSGSGRVRYIGDPDITQSVSGSGSVRRAD